MSVCIDNSKFLSKTVTKRIYVRDILIDIPKAGQATNEPLVHVGKKQEGKKLSRTLIIKNQERCIESIRNKCHKQCVLSQYTTSII